MANTGNTQQQINYGTSANDGLGDPLRTAFIKTDNNFDNVWLAGPVGSNITIANNTIQSNNTNGNIILKPNGVGVIQANASIIPNTAAVRDLGSANLTWRRAYIDELLPSNLTVTGSAVITGNLTVEGNTIQIGNITTDTLTVELANAATTPSAANGAGITVGSDDNIASILYNSTANRWNVSVGLSTVGNISAPYFTGNGSLLTGIVSSYGNANVAAYLPTYTGNISAGNISVNDVVAAGNINTANGVYGEFGGFSGKNGRGIDAVVAGVSGGTFLGTDVIIQITGNSNAYTQFNFQNINDGTEASADYVITADNGDDTTHFLNVGLTGSGWDGSQDNSLGNLLGPDDGYFYVQDGNLVIGTKEDGNSHVHTWKWDTTGNVTATGNLIPSANLTYSLGNSTNWWSNIWVASNTIYIGGVALGVTGNTLTVAGEPVLSNDSESNIATTGTITASNIITNGISSDDSTFVTVQDGLNVAGDIESSGNITADYFFGNGSQLTGLSTGSLSNGTSNVEIATANGNVTVTAAGTQTWTFDDTGNLALPNNGSIIVDGGDGVIGPVSDDMVISWDNEEIRLVSVQGSIEMQADNAFRVQTNYDGANVLYASRWEFSNNELVNISGDFGIVSEAGNLTLSGGRDGVNSGKTIISSVDLGNAVYNWTFGTDSVLTTPGDINIDGDITGTGSLEIQAAPNGNAYVNLDDISDSYIGAAANLSLLTDADNREWIFDTTGTLTTPGDITVGGDVTGRASANTLVIKAQPTTDTYIQLNSIVDSTVSIAANLDIVTDSSNTAQTFAFGADGSLSVPGNITTGNILTDGYYYANGDPFISSDYGDSNVVTLLSSFGSNTISTTGNVTAANFIGNISITGNVTGTSANVELVAGSYTWTFDNTGVATFPGNVSVTGNVITPNRPAFRVYGNGVTNVSTTTNTTGVLNGNNWAVDYNQGSYLNSTTGTFTAPVAGLYQVNLVARVANNIGSMSQAIVYKNYGGANTTQVMWETAANCTVNHFGVSTVSKLAVGDTLSLVVTVGELTFDVNDNWSVAFLG